MAALDDGVALVDGRQWLRCTQSGPLGCNWLVPVDDDPAARGRCLSDTLIRRKPDADDTIAREKLIPTAAALRRLVYQLIDLGLPVDPYWCRDDARYDRNRSTDSTGIRSSPSTVHDSNPVPGISTRCTLIATSRCVLDNGKVIPSTTRSRGFPVHVTYVANSPNSARDNVSPFLGQRRLAGNRVGRL